MSYSEFLRKYILGFAVLSNVDRKYYQCIPKRRRRSDFKAEMYSWFIHRRGGTIASPFFLSEKKGMQLYTLIIFTVYIWKNIYRFYVSIENTWNFVHTVIYQKTRHGAAITVLYFTFVKKTDPNYIWKMNPREHILEPLY
jgi:hypothetical protein